MDKTGDLVYSKNVIEFVAVANEYCAFIDNVEKLKLKQFVDKIHKILPLLYLKATLLPTIETQFDEANEKFVSEYEYNQIQNKLLNKLGQYDTYQKELDPTALETDEPLGGSLSEDLSDIYQDMKDFLMLYRISTNEIMNDAIWECKYNFEEYWGQSLVNALRVFHVLRYGGMELEDQLVRNVQNKKDADDDNGDGDFEDIDTSSWIINKRFEDFQTNEE
ncbi:MAG: DUF5063 domain-containing protein [Bacteroidales bacterium]|nr:DUF5063 domain-containing protein [Bacteroidales bacterium]